MHLPLLAVFVAWIPIGIFFFRRYPARIAVLANFLAGWAILPTARFVPSPADFPYWIIGVCLPSQYLLTKATVPAIAALGGMLIFHRHDLFSFRFRTRDLPMAVWCCVPLLSALAHPVTLHEGLFGTVYQTIAWGLPWLLGRVYFSDRESLLLAAKATVIAAVCYVPVCLIEFFVGPRLYDLLYGYQPYRWIGADRYLGFRPIGLLEDGNQLGIWMAGATMVAIGLSVGRHAPRVLGLPMTWVAVGLAGTTIMCQSAGSIILLLLLLPVALLRGKFVLRASVAVLVLGIVFFAALRMSSHVSLRALAESNAVLRSIAYNLSSIGRHSFLWRLARDESHMSVALQHPLLGSGRWNWWQNGDARPWSLWLLVFGMYGIVGLAAFGAILFMPIIRTVGWALDRHDEDETHLRRALIALFLMVAIDNLLNSAMILPYLIMMAGLASPVEDRQPFTLPSRKAVPDRRVIRRSA